MPTHCAATMRYHAIVYEQQQQSFLLPSDMERRQTDKCKIQSEATPSSPGGMPFSSLKPPLRGSGPAPPVHPSRAAATAAAAFSSAFLFLFSSCHSQVRLQRLSVAAVQAHTSCYLAPILFYCSHQAGPSTTASQNAGMLFLLSTACCVIAHSRQEPP